MIQEVYNITGNNNRIIIVEEDGLERELGHEEKIPGLNIVISGNDNFIKIIQPCFFNRAELRIEGSNNGRIIIDKTPKFMWVVKLAAGKNQIFEFGEGSSTAWFGQVHILDSNAGVKIGKDCMFSGDIMFLASDGHKIVDIENNKILNAVEHCVEIGNHVWCATSTKFLSKAKIANNSIVGAFSIVTKAFDEENVVVAGNPAKIVKRGINWIR